MSDKYSRQRTSSRRHKQESSKSSKRRNSYQEYKKYEIEAKTPPLPKNRHSIEDLMRERQSLKEELEQLNPKRSTNIKKYSRESSKRKHEDNRRKSKTSKTVHIDSSKISIKSRTRRHVSPEYTADKCLDSEDEESIIEQRRKRRKQLLEKLNVTDTSTNNEDNISKNEKSQHKQIVKHLHHDTTSPSDNNLPQKENKQSDMFSEKDDFTTQNVNGTRNTTDDNNSQLTDNWDDADGYYIIRAGDKIKNQYVLKEVLGQGVFANVIHAQDTAKMNASVAIKMVRNNELMYKTSLKEISILKEINIADPDNKYHCVKYICNFTHKGHLCIVLEALHMDLRSILKKYGKNYGIHMKALLSYSRQLLMALRLLKKIGIVHADIKPDNILVNEKKNILKLCDFGSAAKLNENEPTPYLVSRFYRAPEIILGAPYNHGVDIWSSACTISELATGRILFTGNSNNRMLKCFMDLKGKIPVKLIKKGKFKDQHFNYNNNFLLHKKDEFTGRDKVIEVCNNNVARDLYKELLKSCKSLSPGEEKKLAQLKDLLDKMLMLDPNQRYTVSDCLKHPFIQDVLNE